MDRVGDKVGGRRKGSVHMCVHVHVCVHVRVCGYSRKMEEWCGTGLPKVGAKDHSNDDHMGAHGKGRFFSAALGLKSPNL